MERAEIEEAHFFRKTAGVPSHLLTLWGSNLEIIFDISDVVKRMSFRRASGLGDSLAKATPDGLIVVLEKNLAKHSALSVVDLTTSIEMSKG